MLIYCVVVLLVLSVLVFSLIPSPGKPPRIGGGGAAVQQTQELEEDTDIVEVDVKIKIGDSTNVEGSFTGEQEIVISENDEPIVKARHDFDAGQIDFSEVEIQKQDEDAELGVTIVKNLNLPEGEKKTVYVDNVNKDVDTVCIVDKDIGDISDVSKNCNGPHEVYIECNSQYKKGYKCKDLGDKYEVSGLQHSMVIQKVVDIFASDDSDVSPTVESPKKDSSGMGWLLWSIIILVLLVVGIGSVFYVTTKKGVDFKSMLGKIMPGKSKQQSQQISRQQMQQQQHFTAPVTKMDQSLKLYIDNALIQGYSKEQVIHHLMQHGYSREQLEGYF